MLDGTQSNQGPLFTLTSKPSPCSLEETQHGFFARQRGFLRAWSPGLKPKAARTRLASFLCKGLNISWGRAHLCCYRTGAAVDSSLWRGRGALCAGALFAASGAGHLWLPEALLLPGLLHFWFCTLHPGQGSGGWVQAGSPVRAQGDILS